MIDASLQALKAYLEKLRAVNAPPAAVAELQQILAVLEGVLERQALERRRLLDQLYQAARLSELGAMAASILHEMNQPLLGIKGFAELIVDGIKRDDTLRLEAWATEIREQVVRIEEIQKHLAGYLRRDEDPNQPVAFNTVLREAVTLFEHRLQKLQVRLEVSLPPDLPPLEIARLQLNQILVNLVGNALDACENQPVRWVKVAAVALPEAGKVRILVADHGVGIPEEARGHIFEPFFTTKGQKGTGLGLHISRTLAVANGGALELADAAALGWPEKPATVFVLTLPVAGQPHPEEQLTSAPAAKPMPAPEIIRALNTRLEDFGRRLQVSQRVLVVDDEVVIQRVLSDFLATQNILCDVVSSAEEALEKLTGRDYAVVLTDKNLPGMDGVDLLRKIKKQWPLVEVLVITGYASVESALDAIGEGAFDYITKPLPSLTLIGSKVRGALARHDFESRVHAMIDFLAQFSKSLSAEAGEQDPEGCARRLREILASYGQPDSQGKVLVVGPTAMFNTIERLGYNAIHEESLDSAVHTLGQREVHVVVFVEEESGSSGAEAVRRLQARDHAVGVFVIARAGDLKPIIETIGAGVGDYLARPLEGKVVFPARLQRLVARQQKVTRYRHLLAALKDLNVDLMANLSPQTLGLYAG